MRRRISNLDDALPEGQTRLTIGFSPEQIRWMDAEARRRALTLSELLRRLVDEARGAFLMRP